MSKRKKYTKEFKLDAISLVRDQNLNIAEASRNLGVSPQMLGLHNNLSFDHQITSASITS
jgi:transposase-like protein